MYDPRSKGAESYIRLAKEIIERQVSAGGLAEAQLSSTTGGTEVHGEDAGQEQGAAGEELDKTA
jgi:hypothetical protein